NVGAGVVLTHIAPHLGVHGGDVPAEAGVGEVHPPIERVHPAAAAQPGGCHAVEGVRTSGDGGEKVIRFGHLRLRSEEHTSELQSRFDIVCRLLLEKKKMLTL